MMTKEALLHPLLHAATFEKGMDYKNNMTEREKGRGNINGASYKDKNSIDTIKDDDMNRNNQFSESLSETVPHNLTTNP
jgi:hypothetical protein